MTIYDCSDEQLEQMVFAYRAAQFHTNDPKRELQGLIDRIEQVQIDRLKMRHDAITFDWRGSEGKNAVAVVEH